MKPSVLAAVAAVLALPVAAVSAPAQTNLSGVWSLKDYSPTLKPEAGGDPPLSRAGKAAYAKTLALAAKGDRSFDDVLTACLPPGLPRLMLIDKPFEIIQRDKTVFFVHQENRLPRRVYLDESLPTDPELMYDGYSVGKWEGDTLVVQSSGFRAGTLLDDSGLPHTTALKLGERYRLLDGGATLEARFTIEDPGTFTRPWTAVARYQKRPGFLIPEEVCAERLKTTAPRNSPR
jgi:hypothetical protein